MYQGKDIAWPEEESVHATSSPRFSGRKQASPVFNTEDRCEAKHLWKLGPCHPLG